MPELESPGLHVTPGTCAKGRKSWRWGANGRDHPPLKETCPSQLLLLNSAACPLRILQLIRVGSKWVLLPQDKVSALGWAFRTSRVGAGFPWWLMGKESTCQCRRLRKPQLVGPWGGKTPWRRTWQPTPVFLPGESHGQRGLEGCRPWGRKGVRHD